MRRRLTVDPVPAPPPERETPPPSGSYLSREPLYLGIALALALSVFFASWYRHATYRSTSYDLAVFDQAVWLMAHGRAPFVTLIGRNIFTDHFSPALVLFVPLYLIVATPLWLFAAQAVAVGIGVLALPPLFRELGLPKRWVLAFTLAYVLSPLMWNAVLFDFHPTTLAVPFLLIGLTAAIRDRPGALWLAAGAALLLRQDLGLAVIGLAMIGIGRSRHRPMRAGLPGASLLVYPGEGHMFPVSHWAEMLTALTPS